MQTVERCGAHKLPQWLCAWTPLGATHPRPLDFKPLPELPLAVFVSICKGSLYNSRTCSIIKLVRTSVEPKLCSKCLKWSSQKSVSTSKYNFDVLKSQNLTAQSNLHCLTLVLYIMKLLPGAHQAQQRAAHRPYTGPQSRALSSY